jgi:hypothetical protein
VLLGFNQAQRCANLLGKPMKIVLTIDVGQIALALVLYLQMMQ